MVTCFRRNNNRLALELRLLAGRPGCNRLGRWPCVCLRGCGYRNAAIALRLADCPQGLACMLSSQLETGKDCRLMWLEGTSSSGSHCIVQHIPHHVDISRPSQYLIASIE